MYAVMWMICCVRIGVNHLGIHLLAWLSLSLCVLCVCVSPASSEEATLSRMAARIKQALYPTKPVMMSACYWLSQLWMTEQRRGGGVESIFCIGVTSQAQMGAVVCVRVCVWVCVCDVGDGWDPAVLVSADIICPSCCYTVYNNLSVTYHSLLFSLTWTIVFSSFSAICSLSLSHRHIFLRSSNDMYEDGARLRASAVPSKWSIYRWVEMHTCQ